MRKMLAFMAVAALTAATTADAADMPTKASYSQPYSWTGCYLGLHGGGGWSQNNWNNNTFAAVLHTNELGDARADGWLAGGQAGCDYQTGALVFGIEGRVSAAGLRGQGSSPFPAVPAYVDSRIDGLATGTARFGYAFDRALPYIKGGLAFVEDGKQELDGLTPGGFFAPVATGGGGNFFGWTVGAGLEVTINPNWSWKVEYDYIDLGTNGVTLCLAVVACGGPGSISAPFDIRQEIQTVAFGINYRLK